MVDSVTDVEIPIKHGNASSVLTGVNSTYVMSFRNNGPSIAENGSMTDTFTTAPGDTVFTVISVSPTTGTCAGLVAGNSYSGVIPALTCNVGNMNALEGQSVTLVIRPNYMSVPPVPRTLNNDAAVTTTTQESDGPPSTLNTNNSKPATLEILPAEVDMIANKTDLAPYGPDPLGFDPTTPANNVIAYRVRVTNGGPSFASGVVFTDTMTTAAGKSMSFLGDSAVLGAPAAGICTGTAAPFTGASVFTCTVPTGMSNGDTYERILYFRVESSPEVTGDTYSDSVVITANEPESNIGNNTATETTTVRVRADLEVTSKTPSTNPININEPFNWTIVVTNNGPGDSADPRLTDSLPANMELTGTPTYHKTAPAGTGNCTCVSGHTRCFHRDLGPFNSTPTA